jgi:hypothetical protein
VKRGGEDDFEKGRKLQKKGGKLKDKGRKATEE